MAKSVDSDQTAPSGAVRSVYTVCFCYFVKNFGVWKDIYHMNTVKGYHSSR